MSDNKKAGSWHLILNSDITKYRYLCVISYAIGSYYGCPIFIPTLIWSLGKFTTETPVKVPCNDDTVAYISGTENIIGVYVNNGNTNIHFYGVI